MDKHDNRPARGPASAKVFISYSRKNQEFADRLDGALKQRGLAPSIDRRDIYAFDDWWRRIESLIVQADTIVFVVSPESMASPICQREVAFAVSLNKRLAPIVFRREAGMQIPKDLSRLNFIDFDVGDFDENADRLHEALTTDIEWVRQHTEFGALARRWLEAGKPGPRGMLLRSPALEEAERWAATRPEGAPMPTEETQAFITASRGAATRRRNVAIAILSGGLVVAVTLSIIALWQREIAERNFDAARRTADGVVFDMAMGLRDVDGMRAETLRKILDRAAAAYDKLILETGEDTRIVRSQAAMYVTFAETYAEQGDPARQLEAANKGLELARRVAEREGYTRLQRREVAVAQAAVAAALFRQGKFDAALQARREVLSVYTDLAKQEDRSDARRILQRDVLTAWIDLGDAQKAKKDLPAALGAYRSGLAIAQELAKGAPDGREAQQDLATAHLAVANALAAAGDLSGALREHREALAVAQRMSALQPDNTRWKRILSLTYEYIGGVLEAQGDLREALGAYKEGAAVADALTRLDSRPHWMFTEANFYGRIGDIMEKTGQPDRALEAYQGKLELMHQLEKVDYANELWSWHLADTLLKIGDRLVELKRSSEALAHYRECLSVRERRLEAAPTDIDRQLGIVDVLRRLAQNGDRPKERWQRIVAAVRPLRDDPRLTPRQRKWLLDNLPLFEQELAKASR